MAHTVLVITTKSPEIKDLEILDFTLENNFLTFYILFCNFDIVL